MPRKNKDKDYSREKNPSPTSGKRGCLCKNNTYSTKCCDGSLRAQGI